jgi:hypothetical protein
MPRSLPTASMRPCFGDPTSAEFSHRTGLGSLQPLIAIRVSREGADSLPKRGMLHSPSPHRTVLKKRLKRPRFRNWEHHDKVAAGRCHLWSIAPGAVDRLAPKTLNTKGRLQRRPFVFYSLLNDQIRTGLVDRAFGQRSHSDFAFRERAKMLGVAARR